MNINKSLIPIKATYLFYMAVYGGFFPFKTIFQKQLGMSYSQNGIIEAVGKVTRCCLPPVVTAIADKFTIHKIIMISFILLAICASVPMYFLTPVSVIDQNVNCVFISEKVFCYGEDGVIHICTLGFNSTIWSCYNSTLNHSYNMSCDLVENVNQTINHNSNLNLSTCVVHESVMDFQNDGSYQITFVMCVVLTMLQALFIDSLSPLIDGSALNMLGPEKVGDYGKQRLFGSIGFGLSGLLTGILIDFYTRATGQTQTDYAVIFIGISLFCLLTAISLYFLKVPQHTAPSFAKGIKKIFKNNHVPILLFVVFISGILVGIIETFGFLYISTLPDASQTVLGIAILVTCASEIPMFFMSGWIIKKIGCPACLCLGLLCESFRVFCYTVLTSAWQLLLVTLLNAFSFALLFSATNTYATILAPKGMNSTMISLTQATYIGLGNIIGSLYGGFVYDKYGAMLMFRIAAAVGCSSAILYFVIEKCLQYFCPNPKSQQEKTEAQIISTDNVREKNNLLKNVENSSL